MIYHILRGIRPEAGTRSSDVPFRWPVFPDVSDPLRIILRITSPGMILARAPSSHSSPGDERSCPLRISRGEQARHRRTLGHTKNDGGFKTRCIHDRTNIVGALLECGHLSRTVREPCPALIKPDQSADLSQFQKKIRAH